MSDSGDQSQQEKGIWFNTNDFPEIYLFSQFNTFDELLRHYGVDPETLKTDDQNVS
jgi:hypothetical protein